MRAVAAAVALLLASILENPSHVVTASPIIGHDSFIRAHPWGVIPYGGETPTSSSSSALDDDDDDNDTSDETNATAPCTETSNLKSTSSKILDSVSAGGACSSEAVALTSAFVGAASASSSSSLPTTTTQATQHRKSPPFGTTGEIIPREQQQQQQHHPSTTSLSIATDPRNEAADAVVASVVPQRTSDGAEEQTIEGDGVVDVVPSEKGNRPLKILFLSSDTGGGHRASAEALANHFQRHYPGTTYDLMDVWSDIDSSWPYNTIQDTYKSFSATPWKWRILYHVSNNAFHAKFADYHSYYMNEDKIREKMEEYAPDVVVSVHPTMNYVPLFSVRKISEKTKKDIPFFTVVTDFGSGHCTWFNRDVDRMYLASEPIKKIAQRRAGVPDEKIVMTGLPIRYDFACQADAMGDRTTEEGKAYQKKMREQLNIDPNKRMVLVMGGGEGVGSLSDIVNELYAKLRTQGVDATICVVCGRNEKLKDDLETRCWDTVVSQSLNSYESLRSRFFSKVLQHASRSRRIQKALDRAAAKAAKGNDVAETPGNVDVVPLGFVKNMAEFMVAADVLVSKAGPGTIAEAAAVGLPIMVTSHLPGQEAGNVDIVLNGGFGDFCIDPESIALEVACWLQDPQLLDVMSQKAMTVGHPHAAEEIALDIGKITHQWLEKNKLR